MEIKTCEERVLMELDLAEKKVAELEKENESLRGPLDYADKMLGIFKQIIKIEETREGKVRIGLKEIRELDVHDPNDAEVIMYLRSLLDGVPKEGGTES